MTDLLADLQAKGVDLQPYRMLGIARVIETFNANEKRKFLFNPTIINSFRPIVKEIFTATSVRRQLTQIDGISSEPGTDESRSLGALSYEPRLLELLYHPQEAISSVAFYNLCDSFLLIEIILLQLSDAFLNAIKENATSLFFKVESRILYALDETLIYFSSLFRERNIDLYVEIGYRPLSSNDIIINTLIKLHENEVKLVIDNFAWRGGDWRDRFLSIGIFCCVKLDTPPLIRNEINGFKDSLLLLQEKYNMKTIVGKIETKKQSEIVLSTGCWAVQGLYYARPRAIKLMDLNSL